MRVRDAPSYKNVFVHFVPSEMTIDGEKLLFYAARLHISQLVRQRWE